MDTGKLKTEDLIHALRSRAALHRDQSAKHESMRGFYETLALQCEAEAHKLEDKLVLETVQADPFAQAMAECGASEIRWGREKPAENGRQAAPRCTVRAGWPFREQSVEKAQPKRWPY